MKRIACGIIGVFVLLCAGAAAAADPFLGVWKLNPAKSKGEGGVVAGQTVTVTLAPAGHTWSYDTELKSGKHLHSSVVTNVKAGTLTMHGPDGKLLGEGKLTKLGPTAWEVVTPKHQSTGSISADGKTMTVVQTKPSAMTMVFDKIQ